MDRRVLWRAAGGVSGLVAVWCAYRLIVLGHHGTLCHLPLITDDKAALGATRSPGACLEYWFNRYQTLLGVLAAVGAAWLAWRAAEKSVSRVDAGLALSRQQMAVSAVEHLRKRQEGIYSVRKALESANYFVEQTDVEQSLRWLTVLDELNRDFFRFDNNDQRNASGFEANFSAWANNISQQAREIVPAYYSLTLTEACRSACKTYMLDLSRMAEKARFAAQSFHGLAHDHAQRLSTENTIFQLRRHLDEVAEARRQSAVAPVLSLLDIESEKLAHLIDRSLTELER